MNKRDLAKLIEAHDALSLLIWNERDRMFKTGDVVVFEDPTQGTLRFGIFGGMKANIAHVYQVPVFSFVNEHTSESEIWQLQFCRPFDRNEFPKLPEWVRHWKRMLQERERGLR